MPNPNEPKNPNNPGGRDEDTMPDLPPQEWRIRCLPRAQTCPVATLLGQ